VFPQRASHTFLTGLLTDAPEPSPRAEHLGGGTRQVTRRTSGIRRARVITAACVEVADLAAGGQAVRDSKLGDASPVLSFTTAQLSALAAAVRDGSIG
jgi:hypothetical protein